MSEPEALNPPRYVILKKEILEIPYKHQQVAIEAGPDNSQFWVEFYLNNTEGVGGNRAFDFPTPTYGTREEAEGVLAEAENAFG